MTVMVKSVCSERSMSSSLLLLRFGLTYPEAPYVRQRNSFRVLRIFRVSVVGAFWALFLAISCVILIVEPRSESGVHLRQAIGRRHFP